MHRRGDSELIRNVISTGTGQSSPTSPSGPRSSWVSPGRPRGDSRTSSPSSGRSASITSGSLPTPAEEGTEAAALPSRISEREKERRRSRRDGGAGRDLRARSTATLIGTGRRSSSRGKAILPVTPHVGRCRRQAPEIDGVTHIRNGNPEPGAIVACRITAADDYDLYADML